MVSQAVSSDVPVQRVEDDELLQGEFAAESPVQLAQPPDEKPNNTGLPDHLKAGVESLSGMSLDNVKVHYNSSAPAQLNAHAYAQGTDIHVGPGQEQHLPHEAWHVVQQAQGRVKPTVQMKDGVGVNDDQGLEAEADLLGGRANSGVVHARETRRVTESDLLRTTSKPIQMLSEDEKNTVRAVWIRKAVLFSRREQGMRKKKKEQEEANELDGQQEYKERMTEKTMAVKKESRDGQRDVRATAAEKRIDDAKAVATNKWSHRKEQSREKCTPEVREYLEQEEEKQRNPMTEAQAIGEFKELRNLSYTDVKRPDLEEDATKTGVDKVVDIVDKVNGATTLTGLTDKGFDFFAKRIRTQRGLLRRFPRSNNEKKMRRAGQIGAVGSGVVGFIPVAGGAASSVGYGMSAGLKARGEGSSDTEATLRGIFASISTAIQGLIPVGGTVMSAVNLTNDTLDLARGEEKTDPNIIKKLAEHKTKLAILHERFIREGHEVPSALLHVKKRIADDIDKALERMGETNKTPARTRPAPRRRPVPRQQEVRRAQAPIRPSRRAGGIMTMEELKSRDSTNSEQTGPNRGVRAVSGGGVEGSKTLTTTTGQTTPPVLHLVLRRNPMREPRRTREQLEDYDRYTGRNNKRHPQDTRTDAEIQESLAKGKTEEEK